MELEEHCHEDADRTVKHVSDLNHDIFHQKLLVLLFATTVVSVNAPLDGLKPCEAHRYSDEVANNEHVDKQ